jgi:enoyl-CoA hydratase/carnithine racemase
MNATPTTDGLGAIVLHERVDGIVRLTLNRPQARNSLSEALMASLMAALEDIEADRSVRAVILAANGPVFCAGHDLKEMTAARAAPDRGRATFERLFAQCSRLMMAIVRLPQPVIAEVHGTATAAGCQLVASCDLAVAADTAHFCTPGMSIGLFCSTPMIALTRNVPRKVAMEMLMTADMVPASDAKAFGLVNRVVPAAQVRDETMALASQIASRSGLAARIGKEAFYRQMEMGMEDAYMYAAKVMVENMLARDADEGISAFIDKRPADWERS